MRRLFLVLTLAFVGCGGGGGSDKPYLIKVDTQNVGRIVDGKCSLLEALNRERDCILIPYTHNEIRLEVPVYVENPPIAIPYSLALTGNTLSHAFTWNFDKPLLYVPQGVRFEVYNNINGIIHNDGTIYLCMDCQVWAITGSGKVYRF